ncbi:MAG TPA: penicillin-binding transpeptidase domain-containing protein, partial [Pyrinomonadaceae bacterium]|nr:penicillin-binding transpeptidase domain-containing protein [Pyrinomonadaceae bacterium]
MKLMFPKLSIVGSLLALFVLGLAFNSDISAQSKKAAAAKKAQAHAKDARKDREKAKASAKNNKKGNAKQTAKEKEKAKKAEANAKKDPKKAGESKRASAERRRKEEERRQAIIAEQRRREQAAREARARKLAFEHGLRTETVTNISHDVTDGEDLSVRAAAINALGSHAGSVVVMEAQTGKVLTIVNQDWAVRSSIRPCSTIKLVTGVAGLNEGVISKEDGSIRNRSTRRNLDDAVAFSDNGYFQSVGANLGNTKLVEYAKDLGLGEPTGLNMPGEVSGRLPYNNNNARIYSHGDDTEVSTIQLAVMVSAITNGGHRVLPRIPRNEIEKSKFQAFYKANVELPQQNVRRMIPGMMGAAEYGTAHRNMDQTLGVAGKTGSCIDKGSWVGLFASVAPIEKPKYSVAVITRGQGERGKYAAAVAAQVYRALGQQIVRTDRNL